VILFFCAIRCGVFPLFQETPGFPLGFSSFTVPWSFFFPFSYAGVPTGGKFSAVVFFVWGFILSP